MGGIPQVQGSHVCGSVSLPQLRLHDLSRSKDVGVILGATFCGFYAADNDIEVAFSEEDGRIILGLIQQFLKAQNKANSLGFLVHRFKNLDDAEVPEYENSAFSIRQRADGIELTVDNWLRPGEDLSSGDLGGMAISISWEDAQKLAAEFAGEMDRELSRSETGEEHQIGQ